MFQSILSRTHPAEKHEETTSNMISYTAKVNTRVSCIFASSLFVLILISIITKVIIANSARWLVAHEVNITR